MKNILFYKNVFTTQIEVLRKFLKMRFNMYYNTCQI